MVAKSMIVIKIITPTNTNIAFIRFVYNPGRSNSSFSSNCHKVLLNDFQQSKELGRCCIQYTTKLIHMITYIS